VARFTTSKKGRVGKNGGCHIMGLRVLSLGAGVNSTALLVLAAQGKIGKVDFAIMADTGGEFPETYRYIEEHIKPLCEKYDIPLVIERRHTNNDETLEQYCLRTRFCPSHQSGSCRDNFKIQVIRRYLKKNYPLAFKNIETLIGFCRGEERRLEGYKGLTELYSFPLMDLGLDRLECAITIKNFGLPVPPKSGCWFCSRQSLEGWVKLFNQHPELFNRSEIIEKNGKRYPEIYLSWDYPLEVLRRSLEAYAKQAGPKERAQVEKALYAFMPKTNGCQMCEIEDNECLIEALKEA
jgi:hypothetical protein